MESKGKIILKAESLNDGTFDLSPEHAAFLLRKLNENGFIVMPAEANDQMVKAYQEEQGGVVGTPENLANPDYVERMKSRQANAARCMFKSMAKVYAKQEIEIV